MDPHRDRWPFARCSSAVTGLVGAVVASCVVNGRAGAGGRPARRPGRARQRGKDSSADMLLKQAPQEVDKKTLLERLTPEFFSLHEDVRAGRRATSSRAPCSASRSGSACVGGAAQHAGW